MPKNMRVDVASGGAAIIVGLILGLFEVTGWPMPTPLAIILLMVLLVLLVIYSLNQTICFHNFL